MSETNRTYSTAAESNNGTVASDRINAVRAVPWFIPMKLPVKLFIFQVWEEGDPLAQKRLAFLAADGSGGKAPVILVVRIHGQADLLERIHRLDTAGGRPNLYVSEKDNPTAETYDKPAAGNPANQPDSGSTLVGILLASGHCLIHR